MWVMKWVEIARETIARWLGALAARNGWNLSYWYRIPYTLGPRMSDGVYFMLGFYWFSIAYYWRHPDSWMYPNPNRLKWYGLQLCWSLGKDPKPGDLIWTKKRRWGRYGGEHVTSHIP